jgi:hypothetical protein
MNLLLSDGRYSRSCVVAHSRCGDRSLGLSRGIRVSHCFFHDPSPFVWLLSFGMTMTCPLSICTNIITIPEYHLGSPNRTARQGRRTTPGSDDDVPWQSVPGERWKEIGDVGQSTITRGSDSHHSHRLISELHDTHDGAPSSEASWQIRNATVRKSLRLEIQNPRLTRS